MSVDESTVILGPIDHVGCARASSIVTAARSATVRPRNGPPLAVTTSRLTWSRRPSVKDSLARRHWCNAQCSLSTGTISAPGVLRTFWTTGPAAINDSLLARPSRLPNRSVSRVTVSPAKPTIPLMTTSAPWQAAANASSPTETSNPAPSRSWIAAAFLSLPRAIVAQLKSWAWVASNSGVPPPAPRAVIW